jgi:hypothetical protein
VPQRIDELLVLPVHRNRKHCGALYFTRGWHLGIQRHVGNYIWSPKARRSQKPPVRDLPQPQPLRDRFPACVTDQWRRTATLGFCSTPSDRCGQVVAHAHRTLALTPEGNATAAPVGELLL